jgi:tetratricopeptide (TPR) repeat protein
VSADAWAGAHEDALARFDEGRALTKAGRASEAIAKFLASLAAEPSAVAALNLADCYERIGKLASARERFKQAEQLSSAAGDGARAAEAHRRAEILEPRLSTITVLPPPPGVTASTWVDGVSLPPDGWGKPHPFDNGPHEVVFQAADGKPQTKAVNLSEEGAKVTLSFDVATGKQEVTKEKPTDARPEALRPAALVAGGAGIASLIAGGITGVLAFSAKSELESACATYPQCPSPQANARELATIDSRGRTLASVSTITFTVGAALLAAGVVLWMVASPNKNARLLTGSFTF